MAGRVSQVMVGHVSAGMVSYAQDRIGVAGEMGHGRICLGKAGKTRLGRAGTGTTRQARRGGSSYRWYGVFRQAALDASCYGGDR